MFGDGHGWDIRSDHLGVIPLAFREAKARPCISIMTRRCSFPCTHLTVTAPWQKSTEKVVSRLWLRLSVTCQH